MTKKENQALGEIIYKNTLSSGTKCYIIPKCSYREKMAMIAVNYGSNDIHFQQGETTKKGAEGVAHFLEHKLFEEEWGNVFEEFSKSGAQANAFTDCNKTAYYFSCDKDFDKNFEILLSFVQSPYFTEESTKREKGIISQEITMLDDDPYWKVYFNMLKAMYHEHPVKKNIAGSVQSIQKIDAQALYDCYHAFYLPQNMTIVCAGDVDAKKICQQAERLMKKEKGQRAKTLYKEEKPTIIKPYIEEKMDIIKPVFHIGYKGIPMEKEADPRKIYSMKLLLDLIAGESSAFYQSSYEEGVFDEPLGLQYLYGDGFSFCVVSGTSLYPTEAAQKLKNKIAQIKKDGINQEIFFRLKKKHLGRFIRGFNSINAICMSQIENGIKGFDLMDAYEAILNCKKEELEKLLDQEFQPEKQVVSVIKGN